MSSAALATADFQHDWLVRGVLVRGQPAVLGGPQKSLKTGIAVDLALSLGSGTPFLGTFAVERPARVAMLSGESGEAVLQETAKRICAEKKLELDKADVLWDFRLPQLADPRQVTRLRDRLRESAVAVLVIDPLYLCLLAGPCAEGVSASNLYQIGPLLLGLARSCSAIGVTPVLVHHTKKALAESHHPFGLEDLAFAGIGEFARQWLLLSRREVFTPGSGLHRLWLSVGGSAGHSGLWAVDVDEGALRDDFSGRTWRVSVSDGPDARGGAKEGRQAKQRENEETRLLKALSELDPKGKGAVYAQVRASARLSGQQMTRTVTRLVEKGAVTDGMGKIDGAKNSKRTVRMLRLCPPGSPEPAAVVPVIPTNAEAVSATPGSSGLTPHLTAPPDDRKS